MSAIRRLPTQLPVGFQLEAPTEVEVQDAGAHVVCRERRADGKTIGELDIEVFSAALVIDRDGILEEKAATAASDAGRVTATVPVTLPGASGYRADVELAKQPLPYLYVFAMAPSNDLAVNGGVLVTVRSASPDWPAGELLLRSLRLLTRGRRATANDADDAAPLLPLAPMLGKRD